MGRTSSPKLPASGTQIVSSLHSLVFMVSEKRASGDIVYVLVVINVFFFFHFHNVEHDLVK